jgi:hypothetical protein
MGIKMPKFPFTHMIFAALHIRDGDQKAAKRAAGRILGLAPRFAGRIDEVLEQQSQDDQVRARLVDDLRESGI